MNINLTPLTSSDLEAWWERVPGARRFLQTMASKAEHSRAIVADISEDDVEGFISSFTEEIQRRNYSIVVDRYEVNDNIAEEDFITELAIKFDPDYVPDLMSDSMIIDVANKKILSGYVIFIKINCKANWLTSLVSDFNKIEDSDKGTMIFLTSETMPSQITMKLTDYISPYDVQFFAINLLEDTKLNQMEKLYTATLLAKLAGTSAMIAKNLASADLYFNCRQFSKDILSDDYVSYKFERSVWETQIQFVLPIVETVREKLIARNIHSLKKLLPVADEFGKFLDSPWDMELRHLHYYGGINKNFSPYDWDTLELVYRIRNDLSHLYSIDFERLEKVFALSDF
ncbi:MAG: hypothetical protein IJ797_04635 [Selenomonadaceae bacterium]|nr:hypothetical protein [Selenomonadaceae bacterium]